MQLSINDQTTLIAAYHAFRTKNRPAKLKMDEMKDLVPDRKWELMEGNSRREMLELVNEKVGRLRRSYTEESKLTRAVCDYLGRLGCDRPGWSAYLFEALLANHPHLPRNTRVRVGVDISRLYVK